MRRLAVIAFAAACGGAEVAAPAPTPVPDSLTVDQMVGAFAPDVGLILVLDVNALRQTPLEQRFRSLVEANPTLHSLFEDECQDALPQLDLVVLGQTRSGGWSFQRGLTREAFEACVRSEHYQDMLARKQAAVQVHDDMIVERGLGVVHQWMWIQPRLAVGAFDVTGHERMLEEMKYFADGARIMHDASPLDDAWFHQQYDTIDKSRPIWGYMFVSPGIVLLYSIYVTDRLSVRITLVPEPQAHVKLDLAGLAREVLDREAARDRIGLHSVTREGDRVLVKLEVTWPQLIGDLARLKPFE